MGFVGAQEVPGVEAREVLEGAQELVAADGGGDEFEVVRDRGVVDERVGDHFGGGDWVVVLAFPWMLCVCAGVYV